MKRKTISRVYAKFQKRDRYGRFVKESKTEKTVKIDRAINYLTEESASEYIDEIKTLTRKRKKIVKQTSKEEIEPNEEWEYFIGASYKSNRGTSHDFTCEFKVTSDKKLSDEEIAERINQNIDQIDSTLGTVVSNCSFRIKNSEKRETNVPQNSVKLGKIRS